MQIWAVKIDLAWMRFQRIGNTNAITFKLVGILMVYYNTIMLIQTFYILNCAKQCKVTNCLIKLFAALSHSARKHSADVKHLCHGILWGRKGHIQKWCWNVLVFASPFLNVDGYILSWNSAPVDRYVYKAKYIYIYIYIVIILINVHLCVFV